MKELVATLNLIGIEPDGKRIDILATIGKPFLVPGHEDIDEWACAVFLEPLYKTLHNVHSGSSFQALCLASNLILKLLSDFIDKGGQLVHEDGTQFSLGECGFGVQTNTQQSA